MSYKVEIIERKVLTVQLEASKSSTEDLFSDLLNGKKGFKYQITVKFLLKKFKLNGEIEFEHYCKQLPVPFKIYADFECNLRGVESCEGSYTKKYQDHVPCSFAYKVVCIDNRLTKPIVVYRGENAVYEFIKSIVKEYKYCKKVI